MSKDVQMLHESGEFVKRGICEITGESVEVRVPEKQHQSWKSGELIQRAMPQLNDAQREFIITGITGAEWDELFKGCDEEMEISQ